MSRTSPSLSTARRAYNCLPLRRRSREPYAESGLEKWLSLNAEYAKIWPNITVKKSAPPDFKEWEGTPDKLQYFSPNPGAGD